MSSIPENALTVAAVFAELAKECRWICWRKEMRSGEWSKIPRNPNVPDGNASSNNQNTWTTYEDAKVYLRSSDATGIGLMLGGGLVGIDIDHCRNAQTGDLSDFAIGVVNTIDSYTEVSPSGEGVHLLIRVGEDFRLQHNRNKKNDKNPTIPDFEDHRQDLEIYAPVWTIDNDGALHVSHGRYFTFTGKPLDPNNIRPIAERTSELSAIVDKYLPKNEDKKPVASSTNVSEKFARGGNHTYDADISDSERWEWMFGWRNGSYIRALYDGDTSAYAGDESRADQALCIHLAYATRHDSGDRAGIIDRMFRQSALYRDKWEREDYRGWTIDNALAAHPYEPLPQTRRKDRALGPNGELLPDFTADENGGTQYASGFEPPVLFLADGAKTYGKAQYHKDIEIYARSNGRKTGFANIDEHGPFRPGLYCVGAISSLGKSTFCLQLADNLAAAGEHVLFFSAEQDKKSMHAKSVGRYLFDLTSDLYAPSGTDLKSGVDGDKVREAEAAYHQAVEDRLRVIPVRSKLRPKDLDYTVRYYTDMFGKPPVVIVDYIQRLKPDNPRDMERTSMNRVVATMQDLVLDLGVTAIGVSSLNRAGYLQPISFESFKESGDIEYDADVVWGLDLGCMSAPLFMEEKGAVRKRNIIRQAKREIPREVRLTCLKNRDGEPSYDALFYYYPTHEYFEALTGDRIVTDDYGNVDFKAPASHRSWRNLIDEKSAIVNAESRFGDDDAYPTGQYVLLTADMVRGWNSGDAQNYYVGITPPEHRNALRRMLPSQAKQTLLKKLAGGPRRFAMYSDTPELPA